MLNLKIITPKKVILEKNVNSITLPSFRGEITLLEKHTNLFSLLVEGIVKYKTGSNDEHLAIGGGYVETDGQEVNVLVSRAYGQDQLDQDIIIQAIENAKNILKISKDKKERIEAQSTLRRSMISLKLLKKRRPRGSTV